MCSSVPLPGTEDTFNIRVFSQKPATRQHGPLTGATCDSYGHDFSKLHLFQNIGVLIASLAVGHLVENLELNHIFYIALAGYILSGILFYWFTKVDQDAETPDRIMTAKQDTMIS